MLRRVAVVGAGPSGYYAAQTILKLSKDVEVDVYDKLPVPFGLARYGVAPDHPEVKNVGNTFTELMNAEKGRCRFIGNVDIGGELPVSALREHYHQVVFATGAPGDRKLGIPGEDEYIRSARSFVEWYNTMPGSSPTDLSGVRSVAIIGNGNVAVDCARMLVAPPDLLLPTDMRDEAVAAITSSPVRDVHLVGRRGLLHTAFTIKEFRELLNLGGGKWVQTLAHDCSLEGLKPDSLDRRLRRLTELVMTTAGATRDPSIERALHVRYHLRPLRATAEGLVVMRTRYVGNPLDGKVEDTGEEGFVPAELILRSIGYQSFPIEGVPFKRGVIPCTKNGRVVDDSGNVIPGMYAVGWVKNGPVGVIVAAYTDGKIVGAAVNEDSAACEGTAKDGFDGVAPLLKNPTTWEHWLAIQRIELERGAAAKKAMVKIPTVQEMLAAVGKA